jgi:hypothetical protein
MFLEIIIFLFSAYAECEFEILIPPELGVRGYGKKALRYRSKIIKQSRKNARLFP